MIIEFFTIILKWNFIKLFKQYFIENSIKIALPVYFVNK